MEEQQAVLKESISKFLQNESLYEMIPVSGQVLVLEKDLSLLDVIELTLSHKQESCMVWDPDNLTFVGSVDARDLLKIIISQYHPDDMELDAESIQAKLRTQTLSDWRASTPLNDFVTVSADDDLLTASHLLKANKLHRIPIIDTKENLVVGFVSMEAILSFFIENYVADSSLFDHPLSSFSVGTSADIVTAPATSNLLEALGVMAQHNLSSLPLVTPDNKLEGVLYLSDVPQIISSGLYLNRDMPILSVLRSVNETEDSGLTRYVEVGDEDTMKTMIQKLAASPERKLFRLSDNTLTLIITESDLFGYFI